MGDHNDDNQIFWCNPIVRAVIPISKLHISRSLKKICRKKNFEFSINHDLNEIQYNSLGAKIKKNNFVTTFNFIEEEGPVGSANILENVTTFNFNDQNFITFKTRENKEIDLTEYYDLIYEYKNDCLTAGIKFNKTYYEDDNTRTTRNRKNNNSS